MGFHETRFPDEIAYGSRGGPGFATVIVETDAGAEQRVGRWNNPRRRYDAAYGIKDRDDLYLVHQFYLARKGALNGFRFKDHLDYTSNALDGRTAPAIDDQLIGTGDGTKTQFQLIKRYTSGPVVVSRNIRKPVAGTILVEVNGVAQVITVDFTVDTTTGVITFNTAPPLGQDVKAGFEFDVPVRFTKEADTTFQASIDFFDTGSITSIPMLELLDPEQAPDDFFYGGASAQTIDGTVDVLISNGRVQDITYANAAGDIARLPDETNLPPGGPYFYLLNSSGNDGTVEDQSSNVIGNHPDGTNLIILLSDTGWVAI